MCVNNHNGPSSTSVPIIHAAPNFKRDRLATRRQCAHGSMILARAGLGWQLGVYHHIHRLHSYPERVRNKTKRLKALSFRRQPMPDRLVRKQRYHDDLKKRGSWMAHYQAQLRTYELLNDPRLGIGGAVMAIRRPSPRSIEPRSRRDRS